MPQYHGQPWLTSSDWRATAEQRIDTEPTERSISLSSSTSTTPTAIVPVTADLEHEVREVARREVRRLLELEVGPDHEQADEGRQPGRARPAGRASTCTWQRSHRGDHAPGSLRLRGGCTVLLRCRGIGHHAACRARPMIAATTSSGVVSAWRKVATRRPSRRTMIRSATSNTSWMLCVITTTPSPCSRRRLIEREHLRRLRDAERRRRLVEDDDLRAPHHGPRDRDRLTLPPGERGHASVRTLSIVVTLQVVEHVERALLHLAARRSGPSPAGAAISRPRNMFATTSRLSQSARSW